MIDWRSYATRGRTFAVDSKGQQIQESRQDLKKGEFLVKYSKSRCGKCREFLWVGSVARYGPQSKKLEHVTCPL